MERRGDPRVRNLIEMMVQFLGGTLDEVPQRYEEASPIKRADKDTPPALLLHGDQDQSVLPVQSEMMHKRLVELGVPSELEIYDGGKGHGWHEVSPDFWVTLERMTAFIKKYFNI